MSDLFTRLTQQAQGAEPGIRPLISPHFAPAPAAVPEAARAGLEAVPETPVSQPTPVVLVPRKDHREVPAPKPAVSPSEPAQPRLEPLNVPLAIPPQPRQAMPQASSDSPVDPPAERIVTGPPSERHPLQGRREPVEWTVDSDPAPAPAPPQILRETVETQVLREVPVLAETDARSNREANLPLPRVSPESPPARALTVERAEAPGESTGTERVTRISIGRVEIRTILQAPAPPPSPKQARPPMSLSDYLQKRNGGGW